MAEIPHASKYAHVETDCDPAIAERRWQVQEERLAAGLLANSNAVSIATFFPELFVANDDKPH